MASRERINDAWRGICKFKFHCIELRFFNTRAFEYFFKHYYYRLTEFFKISINSETSNTLYIILKRDKFEKLNLTYIQSFIKSNGIDYSYLFFILYQHRQERLLDLQTDRLNIPLTGIKIKLYCDKYTILDYYISRQNESEFHSNKCVKIISNSSKQYSSELTTMMTTTTTTNSSMIIYKKIKNRVTITNIFLFITGLIIFLLCILFIFLNLFVRYDKWKNHHDFNQRSSIVLSTFSVDSFDTLKDDNSYFERKKPRQLLTKSSRSGSYSIFNDAEVTDIH
ncbi:unnamed protein product [Rotaria magnacalcarata]|uniref:Uncharacterized protein n=1 Tax=Rotaria magnacalcarata TaxID=392030 RepID=A0A816KQ14_9BILA|nr:unnamed protein product [Rotaria magnacalcarata]CAF1558464.1 unnamed protein product [Rotaria magnacalcarata]CAF1921100.1 unnamed protein product [Rotaria magnacalcarata]CAF2029544.1 unnamed protein product [Rotaria magnacalcarata]CAF3975359.1 unnamed protein product [Rotaria magnacalcarata]